MPHRASRRPETWLARRGGVVELLALPAALFGALARVRSWLYARRLLPIRRVDAPVVCIGNLTAGGTGKTPMVSWVVDRLAASGRRAGVLSRGYRKGAGPGDEASELRARHPGLLHVEDPDRVRGASELTDAGVDAIVLDDGFQHRRLARDVDLVLVDATRPWGLPAPPGGGDPVRAFLPRGLLREPPSALRRASAVVVTRSDAVPWSTLTELEAELARIAPGVPLARAEHRPTRLVDAAGVEHDPRSLHGRSVDLLTGVGNPEAVAATVASLGATVVEHVACPDHVVPTAEDWARLGARPVITTAKDAARLGAYGVVAEGVDLRVLHVAMEILQGREALEALLDGLPPAPATVARDASHAGLSG